MGRMKEQQGAVIFNVVNEAHKVLRLYRNDPPLITLRHNEEDLMMLPWEDYQIGFFVVLIRGQMSKTHDNFTYCAAQGHERDANQLMGSLNVQQLEPGILMASSGCSWDVAKKRFQQTLALKYLAVAFSTPWRLEILGESPDQ